MARYSTIKINTVWLTNNGLSTGDPCRTTIDGLGRLAISHAGSVSRALDGTPYVQTIRTYGRGESISITIETLDKTVYESLVSAVENATLSGSALSVRISGDTGNFYLNCLPGFPQPIETPGTFIEGRLQQVKFNFVVQNRFNILPVGVAAFSVVGTAAQLEKTRKLTASGGTFTMTGRSATLTKT